MTKEKVINELPQKEVNKPETAYRYYCDACTGIAFYSQFDSKFTSAYCEQCGKPLTYKKENYIKMA